MRFELYTSGGERLKGFKVLSYELSSELAAACDGLRLYLYSETVVSSIQAVYAFQNGKKIFNGSADKIQIRADNSGYTLFVYARSGAAVTGSKMKMQDLAQGEVEIRSLGGARILLKNDGSVVINSLVINRDGEFEKG